MVFQVVVRLNRDWQWRSVEKKELLEKVIHGTLLQLPGEGEGRDGRRF